MSRQTVPRVAVISEPEGKQGRVDERDKLNETGISPFPDIINNAEVNQELRKDSCTFAISPEQYKVTLSSIWP